MDGWKLLKEDINRLYGASYSQLIRTLEKLELKRIRTLNNITFLKRCKRMNVIPTAFRIKNNWRHFMLSNEILNRTSFQILNKQLGSFFKGLQHLDNEINLLRTKISKDLDDELYGRVCLLISKRTEVEDRYKKEKLKKKLNNLTLQSLSTASSNNQSSTSSIRSVVNISHRKLSECEEQILSLGLNYAIPIKSKDALLMEAAINIEACIQKLDERHDDILKDSIRIGTSRILSSERNRIYADHEKYRWIMSNIRTLKEDPSIVICPADKGNATVIMNREDYVCKVEDHLSDFETYQVINRDPTPSIEAEVRNACHRLKERKRLSAEMYSSIVSSHTRTPRFYALPKIHKPGHPIRPIIDFRHSPTYNLACFLKKILHPLSLKHPYTLKNSYEIASLTKNILIPPGYKMVSFDVRSLFTKVPVEETLAHIGEVLDLDTSWKSSCSLSKEDVIQLLNICVTSTFFKWNGEFFKQIQGCPTGSPISPIFAEFFMQKLESSVIEDNPLIYFYRRFVDDSYAIIKEDSCDKILEDLNSFHSNIQFTCEPESNYCLPFLDVLFTRTPDGHLEKTVYRKPTHTGRYLNFDSYHHVSQKMSVVDALAYRAMTICDDKHLEAELSLIRSQLRDNGYPLKFVNQRITKMRTKVQTPPPNQNEEQEDKVRFILPYMGQITTRLRNFLESKIDCNFGFVPGFKIGQMICNQKERLSQSPPGIYAILCSCDMVYIGESYRPYTVRVDEHFLRSSKSAVLDHKNKNPDHQISPNSASLIEREPRYFHRKFKESLMIKKEKRKLNKDEGMELHPVWTNLLLPITPVVKRNP